MRILIAEDDPVSRKLLAATLTMWGHEVIATENGRDAWKILCTEPISFLIADWMMPEMDGIELVRHVRAMESDHYVYTILLTSRTEKKDMVRGLEAGADDYIAKPFDRDELLVRVKAGQRVIDLQKQLAEKNSQLAQMALIDGLTGIGNRRSFDEDLHSAAEAARRYRRHLSVAMMDIDFFKLYNDALGHEAGDDALRSVALVLSDGVRTTDAVYRYGGEEFVCIFPETDAEGSMIVSERLRAAVQGCEIPHPGNPLGVVTISVGIASFDPGGKTCPAEELVRFADQALYDAKRSGRNKAVHGTLALATLG